MKSFSIFGDCVSRDILKHGIKEQRYQAGQYVSFINPYSLFTEPYEGDYPKDMLVKGSEFMKRNLELDFRKKALDYLFVNTSDYIIINPLDCRMGLYRKQYSTVTNSNIIRTNPLFVRWLHNNGWEYIPFDEIPEDDYLEANDKLISLVLEHYRPEQIIVHLHYGVLEYAKNEYEYTAFSDHMKKHTEKYNALCKKIFSLYTKIEKIHIIPFPERVYADFRNVWGLMPLHYTAKYYRYGDRAVQTILQNNPNESAILEKLRYEYNIRFVEDRLETEKKKSRYLSDKMKTFLKISEFLVDDNNLLVRTLNESENEIIIYGEEEFSDLLYSYFNSKGMKVKCVTEKEYLYDASGINAGNILILCTLTRSMDLEEEGKKNFLKVLSIEQLLS